MIHVYVEFSSEHSKRQYGGDIEDNLVHYEGVGLIGSSTLCGHTDWVTCDFVETTKRVNCKGCLAVRDHVLGRT